MVEEGVVIAAQLFLRPLALGDVFKADPNTMLGRVLDSECMDFKHAPLGNEATLEGDRLAGFEYGVTAQEPILGFASIHLAQSSPDRAADAADAGLQLERWVRFNIAKVQRLARFALYFLDDAKAFAYRFENGALAFFGLQHIIQRRQRLVRRRCKAREALKLPQILGVERAVFVVGNHPDRAHRFSANLKRNQQPLCGQRHDR